MKKAFWPVALAVSAILAISAKADLLLSRGPIAGGTSPVLVQTQIVDNAPTQGVLTRASGQNCLMDMQRPITTGNTVVGYSHTVDNTDTTEMHPQAIRDDAGNVYTLTPFHVWDPFNEDILIFTKVGVVGSPKTFTFDFTNYPTGVGTDIGVNSCNMGVAEYANAPALTIVNPAEFDGATPNPTQSITPTAPALIWAFAADYGMAAGTLPCDRADPTGCLTNTGYSLVINNGQNDDIVVFQSNGLQPANQTQSLKWFNPDSNGQPCNVPIGHGGCPTVLATVAVQGGTQPPATQVPPPPPLQGAVVHIPTSGTDQTAAINSAITTAASGDTIFFDAGAHTVCGTVNMKAGQLYIGPSVTYPLLGQSSRAVLTGCGYAGNLVFANNNMLYGITANSMGTWQLNGTTGASVRNVIKDDGDPNSTGAGEGEFLCPANDSGTTIDWSTFQNGSGINNCFGGSQNLLFTRNHMVQCKNDCVGPADTGASNEVVSFNFVERPGQNCNGCGTASFYESAGNPSSAHILHNYTTGEKSGGPFCISAIGGGREVAFNYCTGPGAAIEWDPGSTGCSGTCTHNIHDNNMDSANPGSTIFGPYHSSPGSSSSNNIAASITDGLGGCTYTPSSTCFGVSFTAFSGTIPPAPSPPAAGAAP